MIIRAAAAMSIDGKIADSDGRFHRWGSKEDHEFLQELIQQHDVLVLGRITFEHIIARGPLSKPTVVLTGSQLDAAVQSDHYSVDPAKTDPFKFLKRMKVKNVLVLGGTKTYTYFLEHDLIDELYVTVEPIVFGRGSSLFNSDTFVPSAFRLEASKVLNQEGTLLLQYSFER